MRIFMALLLLLLTNSVMANTPGTDEGPPFLDVNVQKVSSAGAKGVYVEGFWNWPPAGNQDCTFVVTLYRVLDNGNLETMAVVSDPTEDGAKKGDRKFVAEPHNPDDIAPGTMLVVCVDLISHDTGVSYSHCESFVIE